MKLSTGSHPWLSLSSGICEINFFLLCRMKRCWWHFCTPAFYSMAALREFHLQNEEVTFNQHPDLFEAKETITGFQGKYPTSLVLFVTSGLQLGCPLTIHVRMKHLASKNQPFPNVLDNNLWHFKSQFINQPSISSREVIMKVFSHDTCGLVLKDL